MKRLSLTLFASLIAFVFINTGCKAQKLKPSDFGIKSKKAFNSFIDGRQQDKFRDFKKAIEFYKAAIAEEPEFGEAYYYMAIDYYRLEDYKSALPHIKKANELTDKHEGVINYYLADISFFNMEYAAAEKNYSAFIKAESKLQGKMNPRLLKGMMEQAKRFLEHAHFAAQAIKTPIDFQPENMGTEINSLGDEYLPKLTADEELLFITARRKECTGGYDAYYGDFTEDFFYSEKKNGKWTTVKNLGPPVNTNLNEGAASFTPDGQWVYFTGCNRDDGFGSCDIYVSKLEGKKWSTPRNLGPIVNTSSWESQPFISDDGKTLYFASARPGGKGSQDIWYSKLENGAWTEPVNMGDVINTEAAEFSPFLHSDGQTFYFSSRGHPGFGGVDLFKSEKTASGWSKPMNLGYPLNTAGDEQTIYINTAGTEGYINSNREGGVGRMDIWKFKLDEKIRPKFTTYVRGFVLDSTSGSPLSATISFVDIETGDTVRTVNTNTATGKFLLTLPVGKEYAAHVSSKGYLFNSEHFELENLSETSNKFFDLVIKLKQLKSGTRIILNNIFYESGSFALEPTSTAELDFLASFLKENKNVKVEIGGHTDNVGSRQDNITLSDNRAKEVVKYLVKAGIPASRMKSKGYGETMPVADNGTAEGRAKNRRTELRIL